MPDESDSHSAHEHQRRGEYRGVVSFCGAGRERRMRAAPGEWMGMGEFFSFLLTLVRRRAGLESGVQSGYRI